MRSFATLFLATLCAVVALGPIVAVPAAAHEYYLLPDDFIARQGEPVAVRHRLGQRFDGSEMAFIDQWNVRSEVWQGATMREIRGVSGDRPALTVTPAGPGLLAVVHQSDHSIASFGWEKFRDYVVKEGMNAIPEAHDARGLSREGKVREAYARFAKTLVAVGDGAGADESRGLKIEIVALENPYTFDPAAPLPVQVLFDGAPLPGVMIKVFTAIDSEHSARIVTDTNGRAAIPPAGAGPYLLNAIHMVAPVSPEEKAQGADWESFWATLTFQRGMKPLTREDRPQDRKPPE